MTKDVQIARIITSLKLVMRQRRISQNELALLADMDPSTLSRRMKQPKNLTIDELFRLHEALKLPMPIHTAQEAWFLDMTGQLNEQALMAFLQLLKAITDDGDEAPPDPETL